MTVAEKHIHHYNRLNGKLMTKKSITDFQQVVKKDIESGRIDTATVAGKHCVGIEKRLYEGAKKMNGEPLLIAVDKIEITKQVVVKPVKKVAPRPFKQAQTPKPKKKLKTTGSGARKAKVAIKSPQPVKETVAVSQAHKAPKKLKPAKPIPGIEGFTTADQAPDKPANTFSFPGEIGRFLGELQRYRLQIIIDGEKHSSKSELAKQIADASISAGLRTALIDWEQGGLQSKDTVNGIKRNIQEDNRKKLFVSNADFATTIEALESIANKFDTIIVDSGSKVDEVKNDWLDTLRVKYPKTIWVILMHQNSKGTTKGGTAAGYNAPIIVKTYRPDSTNQMRNYAWCEKNRGNRTDLWYIISQKQISDIDPSKL